MYGTETGSERTCMKLGQAYKVSTLTLAHTDVNIEHPFMHTWSM